MGLEIDRIDHDGLVLCGFRHSQAFHHLEKYAFVTPTFPAVIKRLGGAIFPWRIAPPEAVAVDENDAAQDMPIINTLATLFLRRWYGDGAFLVFARSDIRVASLTNRPLRPTNVRAALSTTTEIIG